jgi:pyridoxamine 5'-phosphate oxidase
LDDPFALFADWYAGAEKAYPIFPSAMSVATADKQGRPQNRMLLLKGWDKDGFVFYTNMQSRKGEALADNPFAALCFYWSLIERQVRVEGGVTVVSDAEADAYFATRPRISQIGAWASYQSHHLDCRNTLEKRVEMLEEKYAGHESIPRPPHWSGYRLVPDMIEFWQQGEFRLHTRIVYRRENGDAWMKEMIYP